MGHTEVGVLLDVAQLLEIVLVFRWMIWSGQHDGDPAALPDSKHTLVIRMMD